MTDLIPPAPVVPVVRSLVLVTRALLWSAFAVAAAGCESPSRPTPPPAPPALAITCPSAIEVQSSDGEPVAIQVEAPRTSGGVAPVTVSCSLNSGATVPVGATSVQCSAADARGASASCSFQVTVRPPPRLAYTRFLAFGDSLTAGTLAATPTLLIVASPFNYPDMLALRLRTQYPRQPSSVVNEGEPGETAGDRGVARFRSVLQQHRPEVVLLMEGTNDLLDRSAGADRAIAALQAMVREAAGQNVRVALATIPPQRPGGLRGRDAVAASIPAFNDRVRALAAGEGVVLVDVHAAMRDDLSLLGVDDLHPTPQGYSVIAETFFIAIRRHFEVTQ